jgi:hypothetical protein
MLLLQEMCLDGEQRCDERAAVARACKDYRTAAFEIQLKERYTRLKALMMEGLMQRTATTQDIISDLRELAHSLGTQTDAGRTEREPGAPL